MDEAPFRLRRRFLLALAFVTTLALPAAAAHAAEPSPEVLSKITNLNKKAIAAYQKEDFDSARDLLKQALDACNAARLEHHPITARTEIHIGVLLIGGLKQRNAGVKHFQKALSIQPDIQITKTLVTPELQDAFEEAVLGAESAGSGGGDEGGGSNKRRPPPNDEGGSGASGGDEGAGGDEDHPSPRRKPVANKKKPPKKHGDDDEGDDDKKDDDEGGDEGGGYAGKFYIAVMLGSGYGIASGSGETMPATTSHNLKSPGFAPAQAFHIAPEVGYFIKSNLLVSLQVRYQVITGTTASPAAGTTEPSSAIAGLVRGTLFTGSGIFRPFVDVGLGGGYVRHVVSFKTGTGCGPCVETFKGGPILVGPGAGLLLDLGTFGVLAQLNTQLGLPSFTFNVDVQLGAALKF